MTNLPTHIQRELTIVSKSFVKNDQKILQCILGTPKRFCDYNSNDMQKLSASLNTFTIVLGLKEKLGADHRKFLCVTIQEYFPNLNLQEFEIAFKMAGMGKLNIDNKHYQSFSLQYVSDILNSYTLYRNKIYNNYRKKLEQINRDKPTKKITEKESIKISVDLLEVEYKDYALNPDQYNESEYRYTQYKFMYKFLVKYGFIKALNKLEDKILKEYIINFFDAVSKSKYDLKPYLKENWNKGCVVTSKYNK